MDIVSYSELRANLAAHLDRVRADRTEIVVKSGNKEPVIFMTLRDFEGMRETLHLLSTEANADHLARSMAELERGETVSVELPDE